jgi:hypothetical protein
MNKIIVLFVILILGSALTAQTDQLSINFGLSKEEVHSILTDKGFSVSEGFEYFLQYKKIEPKWDQEIKISLSRENIVETWFYQYTAKEPIDWRTEILAVLEEFHGQAAEYDSENGEYRIRLPYNRICYIGFQEGGEICIVSYSNDYSGNLGW